MSGDLEIIEDKTIVELPRKGRNGGVECLRFSFTRAKAENGKETAWHSLRVFWQGNDGKWLPGKSGVTVRAAEMNAITVGFLRALSSSIPRELHGAAKQIVEALGGQAGQ